MAFPITQLSITDLKSRDNENFSCIDCHAPDTNHVSVSHGSFICSSCAKHHQNLSLSIPKPKSESDVFTDTELKSLVSGGNSAFSEFLKYYGLVSAPISLKYHTKAVFFYREMLQTIVSEQEVTAEMPSLEEGIELVTGQMLKNNEFGFMDQPLLPADRNESGHWAEKLFGCCGGICKKIGEKCREFTEKPAVKNAEDKAKMFFGRIGQGISGIRGSERLRRTKESVVNIVKTMRDGVGKVFKGDENVLNESTRTAGFDISNAKALDN